MQAAKQPDIQPGSRALNTLWGLRAVGWTTWAVFTWLSRARLKKTGMLKPNRCMIQRRELWRVNFLYKSMLLLEQSSSLEPSQETFTCIVTFFCSRPKCISGRCGRFLKAGVSLFLAFIRHQGFKIDLQDNQMIKKKNEVMIEPVFTSLSRDSVQCGERSPSAQVF